MSWSTAHYRFANGHYLKYKKCKTALKKIGAVLMMGKQQFFIGETGGHPLRCFS
jgi:hypothetical protein